MAMASFTSTASPLSLSHPYATPTRSRSPIRAVPPSCANGGWWRRWLGELNFSPHLVFIFVVGRLSPGCSSSYVYVTGSTPPFYQTQWAFSLLIAACRLRTGPKEKLARSIVTTALAARRVISWAGCSGAWPAVAGALQARKAVHVNENFRRANFTSADMRESDFSGSTFNGAYLEKAVAYKANFSGADLSDTLMDRMVLNEANLTNAVLVRSVLTRSDLGGAIIEGADFSDAVLDLSQKQALCKYANGTNSITGVDTRKSLGCGNTRRNAYGSPSSPLLSAPPQKLLDRDGFCDSATGLCEAN
ncbi:uncharacterized protein A4U43_C08F25240 [Asparagus officinalis]|nr:uncharacterized protein A4U43_C08F25240 [Asparagus officinalis]